MVFIPREDESPGRTDVAVVSLVVTCSRLPGQVLLHDHAAGAAVVNRVS